MSTVDGGRCTLIAIGRGYWTHMSKKQTCLSYDTPKREKEEMGLWVRTKFRREWLDARYAALASGIQNSAEEEVRKYYFRNFLRGVLC